MNKLSKYTVIAAMLAVVLIPSVALALTQPTNPLPGGPEVTGSTLQRLIESVVQFLITVSVVIAVGVIVWGGLTYMRKPEDGTKILKNGFIGVAVILAVGLILNTIKGFIDRGGTLG